MLGHGTLAMLIRRSAPVAREVWIQGVGLAGLVAIIEGVRRIYSPAAFIVGGGFAVCWTILKVRGK